MGKNKTSKELDKIFDDGEVDINDYLDLSSANKPNKDKVIMNKEIERLNKRLEDLIKLTENEAHKSAILQDALECILEATDDDPRTIAEETLEAIAEYRNWEDQ